MKSLHLILRIHRPAFGLVLLAAELGMVPFVRMDVAVGLAGYVGAVEEVAVLH